MPRARNASTYMEGTELSKQLAKMALRMVAAVIDAMAMPAKTQAVVESCMAM